METPSDGKRNHFAVGEVPARLGIVVSITDVWLVRRLTGLSHELIEAPEHRVNSAFEGLSIGWVNCIE